MAGSGGLCRAESARLDSTAGNPPGRPRLPAVRYMSGARQQQKRSSPAGWGPMPGCLFLDEPTLGVDIGARRYLSTYAPAGRSGTGGCWSPPAMRPELLGLRDRILGPLARGAGGANLPTRGLTLDALLVAINGGQEPSP
ncbi:hypothetical protein LN650_23405 [Klebsiella pneumoniae subsp. pneumoniae]|nr:hypothetical protein [Klebsiella pneumoniae subsp. pneumoniae]